MAMTRHASKFGFFTALFSVTSACIALVIEPPTLPTLEIDQVCPVSKGSRSTVARQNHIFGAGGLWLGEGPVFMGLVWKASSDSDGRFGIGPIPDSMKFAGHVRAKTAWAAEPDFSGQAIVTGRSLDATARPLQFSYAGTGPTLSLIAPSRPADGLWSFWPTSMHIPGPGCYAIQIHTQSGADSLVFEVVAGTE